MARLSGKIAIVTGAGGGIGQAIAQRFAAEGAHVWVTDINGETAEETVRGIKARGRRCNRDGRRRFEGAGSDGTRAQRRGSARPRRRARQQCRHSRQRRGAQSLGFRLDETARGQSRRRVQAVARCAAVAEQIEERLAHQHFVDHGIPGLEAARGLYGNERCCHGADQGLSLSNTRRSTFA